MAELRGHSRQSRPLSRVWPRNLAAVSVIIPVYDRPRLVLRTLASVLAQPFEDFEVIVVDDGSSPPLVFPAHVIAEGRGRVSVFRKENGGASSARNFGMARAKGDYLLFLDSDDVLETNAIGDLMAACRGADIVFGGWRTLYEPTGYDVETHPQTPFTDGYANAVAGGWVTGSFAISRRKAPLFEEGRAVWEVAKFTMDALEEWGTVSRCQATVVAIHHHEEEHRISIAHDHFDPAQTGLFFAAQKQRLADRGLLSDERTLALDQRLLTCFRSLLHHGRLDTAKSLYRSIDWRLAGLHGARHPGSLEWCARNAGWVGAVAFVRIHALASAVGLRQSSGAT